MVFCNIFGCGTQHPVFVVRCTLHLFVRLQLLDALVAHVASVALVVGCTCITFFWCLVDIIVSLTAVIPTVVCSLNSRS